MFPTQTTENQTRNRTSPALTLFLALSFTGCTREEAIQAEFEDFVAEHAECSANEDCVLVYPGCPLGCASAVAREHQTATEDKADALLRRYERSGRSCNYGCVSFAAQCDAGSCVAIESEPAIQP